jgi:hypothetical protein
LTNLAISTLKHLILKGESDTTRLAAVKVLLELPFVQAKLGVMTKAVQNFHSHQHVHVETPPSPELAQRLAGLLQSGGDQAQSLILEALNTEDPSEDPANPKETKPIR